MTWPAVVGWIIIAFGLMVRGPFLLYAFFAFGAFGTLNMIPHEAVGGLNMGPQSFCAVFLILKILLAGDNGRRAVEAALDPRRLGILFLFLIYAIFSAYLMPRLFDHGALIIPVSSKDPIPSPIPLEPTLANVTQSAYMTISVFMTLAFAIAGQSAEFRNHYLKAMLFGGVVLIVTGLIDMVTASSGLADLLKSFRTIDEANLLIDDHVGDMKRVVGLMSEASSYGAVCTAAAGVLAMLRACFPERLRNRAVPPVIVGLVVMSFLSTSSTAYVGLSAFAAVFAFNWVRRALDPHALNAEGLVLEAWGAIAAAFAALVVICFAPTLLDPAYAVVNEVIFNKSLSGSYVERNMWTRSALDAFFATDGLGVGLGGARTSNWYVNILANTGVVGATLLAFFITQLFLYRCPTGRKGQEFITGLKLGLLPNAVMIALAGTIPDFGVSVATQFGLIVALATPEPRPRGRAFEPRRLTAPRGGAEMNEALSENLDTKCPS
jgi:hypothetical protein